MVNIFQNVEMHIQDIYQLNMWKHEYRTILQLIIQLIQFVCVYTEFLVL